MKKGERMSDEQRQKISRTLQGHPVSNRTREQCGSIWKGKCPPMAFKEGNTKPQNAYSFPEKEKHPLWKGGKNSYLSKVALSVYREHFINILCEQCGRTDDMVIHHKDENRRNNDISNLQALCRSCHISHHKKGKKQCVKK